MSAIGTRNTRSKRSGTVSAIPRPCESSCQTLEVKEKRLLVPFKLLQGDAGHLDRLGRHGAEPGKSQSEVGLLRSDDLAANASQASATQRYCRPKYRPPGIV
jgi:hypothetical protein